MTRAMWLVCLKLSRGSLQGYLLLGQCCIFIWRLAATSPASTTHSMTTGGQMGTGVGRLWRWFAVILPCVKACHKLTTIYTCLCMQDCPIYNQLDWHHPQGAGITVLIAMTGMVLVCALYSKLAPWQNQMFKHCDSMNLACNPCSKLSHTIWTITDPW